MKSHAFIFFLRICSALLNIHCAESSSQLTACIAQGLPTQFFC
ncbi:hypothetical protein CPter91_2940 [Collimonas pratensis]|uniref:Uncharacterized protein n=1 Tax=Collimonas pratensis TaxID=279113 RepID=A0A127Q5N0_9BURK|nr:hypothetical protein CPter91_2940 [Collimonas pratensis]